MSTIETLPPEILHHILQWLYPNDLLVLPRLSRTFHSFVQGNKRLCKDIYLNNLVRRPPPPTISFITDLDQDIPENTDLDWEKEVYDVLRLQAICRPGDAAKKVSCKQYPSNHPYDAHQAVRNTSCRLYLRL